MDNPVILASCILLLLWGPYALVWLWQRRRANAVAERVQRRRLMMAETWPSLPIIRPAYHFDHSDTSEETLNYCPQCALESVASVDYRDPDGFYPAPRGVPSFCIEHAATWSMRAAEENA
ncbi:MAG TPA: hypothetical protein VJO13_10010 [Ktedonobacterales bacterium]|nr:hypothetical protein [Ktedonobacterales bacterium]